MNNFLGQAFANTQCVELILVWFLFWIQNFSCPHICQKNLDSPRVGSKPSLKVLQIYPCHDESCSESLPAQSALVMSLSASVPSSHIIARQFLDSLQWLWVWGTSGTGWFWQDSEIFGVSHEQRWELEKGGLQARREYTASLTIHLEAPKHWVLKSSQKKWTSPSHCSIFTSLILKIYT